MRGLSFLAMCSVVFAKILYSFFNDESGQEKEGQRGKKKRETARKGREAAVRGGRDRGEGEDDDNRKLFYTIKKHISFSFNFLKIINKNNWTKKKHTKKMRRERGRKALKNVQTA